MKKLIIPILLLALFGCGPSLKERQEVNKVCAKKHFEEMSITYQANQQQLFIDLCAFNKLDTEQCVMFILNAAQSGKLQEEVTKFAVGKAEEICGKYPQK